VQRRACAVCPQRAAQCAAARHARQKPVTRWQKLIPRTGSSAAIVRTASALPPCRRRQEFVREVVVRPAPQQRPAGVSTRRLSPTRFKPRQTTRKAAVMVVAGRQQAGRRLAHAGGAGEVVRWPPHHRRPPTPSFATQPAGSWRRGKTLPVAEQRYQKKIPPSDKAEGTATHQRYLFANREKTVE